MHFESIPLMTHMTLGLHTVAQSLQFFSFRITFVRQLPKTVNNRVFKQWKQNQQTMQVLHTKVTKQDWAYTLSLTLISLYHKPFAPTISKTLMLQMALKRGECGEQTQVACKDACAVVQYLSLHKCFLRPLEVAGTATSLVKYQTQQLLWTSSNILP